MRRKHWLWLVAAPLLLSGCGDLLEPAAAVVGDHKITIDQVSAALDAYEATDEFNTLTEQGDADAIRRGFEQDYLTRTVKRAVFQPVADRLGIEVTDEELTDRLDSIKGEYPNDSAFEEALKEAGLTFDQLEELVGDTLLEEELRAEITADVTPTAEEVRAYYDGHTEDYEQTKASHILVKSEEEATGIAERLHSAPERRVADLFAQVANESSIDQGAGKGGDLGYFSAGAFVPAFENAAAGLDIGEVSDPVQTEFGWHVILVTDRRVQSFAATKGAIEEQLTSAAVDAEWSRWVVQAYKDADVEVNPRYGDLDLETQRITDPAPDALPGVGSVPTPASSPSG